MGLAVAAVLALVFAPSAGAAMCIRWESEASARPGERVAVAFRTRAPLSDGTFQPWAVGNYPFRTFVRSPQGAERAIAVGPRPADPEVWEGSFVATAEGEWQVRIANFEEGFGAPGAMGRDSASCYGRLLVAVAPAAGGLPRWTWLAVVALGLIALLGYSAKPPGSRRWPAEIS
jgi:hypothetical protein